MPSVLRRIALACFLWFLVVQAADYFSEYWAGYEVSADLSGWVLILVPSLIVPFFALFGTWLFSLRHRKDRLWTTAAVVGVIAVVEIPRLLIAPGYVPVYGFRDRIMQHFALDDLRHFAQDVDQQIPNVRLIDGRMEDLPPDQAAVVGQFKVKYPFMYWTKSGSFDFGPSIYEEEGAVNMDWGGALEGHFGVSISPHGEKNVPPAEPDTRALPASDDIYFYSTGD